jgi:HlyD family secretion protein
VPVKRGDLVATISATGTLEPEAAVDIGAQVAGVIIVFGKDKRGKDIDWGSVVEKGTVLAKIDDSLYAAAVETAKAQLQQAIANKISADANVLQMKANLLLAQQNWDRAQKLGPSDALAQSAYDQYQANFEVAKANLAAAEATVEQTKAAVAQAKASLDTAQINLDYCTIKSPVKGVIVDRRVNIGQTVVSSLSAPSLFLIARDLRRIQAWVSVNEADVGSIFIGQPVTFTVDAYPGRVFQGQVGQVRLNATMTQNVVTYTVEVDTNNDDGKLLPYLTTNAQFTIGHRQGVLLVPNAALRWSPKPNQIAPGSGQTSRAPGISSTRDSGAGSGTVGAPKTHGTVWVAQGEFIRPVHVNVGLTDGTSTEVEGVDLSEGMRVVVGEATREVAAGPGTERSPFTPQIGRGPRQGQGSPGTTSSGR